VSVKGKTSLNSQVGIGSKIQVDGFKKAIVVVGSESLTGQKLSKYKSGSEDTFKAAVLVDASFFFNYLQTFNLPN